MSINDKTGTQSSQFESSFFVNLAILLLAVYLFGLCFVFKRSTTMFSSANETAFYFTVEGLETSAKLQVLSFEGLEAISSDYAVEINLVCNHLRFDITQLLSKPAFLSFDGEQTTGIHGVIQHVRRGAVGKDYALFKVVLTSQLSHLKRRMNQKVFRKKTVPEIISEVLTDYGMAEGLDFEFTLKETYETREYTTQYDQTDYQLINHLAESEGIFYYFTHDKDRHKLIFADANPFFKVRDEAIIYKADAGFVADERVAKRFDIALNSVTTQTAFRNYNFEKMKSPEGSSQGLKSNKLNDATEINLEAYDYPSRHLDAEKAKQRAKIELERFRATQVLAEMDSDVIGLHTGQFIQITEHPLKDVEEHWLIQEIRHAGKQPSVLEALGDQHSANSRQGGSQLLNYFEFPVSDSLEFTLDDFSQGYRNVTILSPKDTAYRPQKLHPKPKVLGTQTAIVTGAAGEEIYCDEYGRVKIQCHWDRLGNFDDNSSDWVRVRTGWAHNGYGIVTVPRVGMEVLVAYEEGDPDFPMIVGALHNGKNKVPYELPAHKTKSVFKTSSSKGGVGSNEFRIEDKAGEEQIFVQAQKDFSQLTKNNHTVEVKNNSHLQVGNEHSETITANRYTHNQAEEHVLVDLDRKTQVMMNDYKQVTLSEHKTVGTITTTQAGQEIHLKAAGQIVIDGGLSLTLKAGGQHIVINPAGIWMTIPVLPIGVPMEGTPSVPVPPLQKSKGVNSVASPSVILQSMIGTTMPSPEEAGFKYNLRYQLKDDITGTTYANSHYIAVLPDNKTIKGITDAEGYTEAFHTDNPENIVVHLLDNKEAVEPMGAPVVSEPTKSTEHSLRYLLANDEGQPYANHDYIVILPNEETIKGVTDAEGYTEPFYSRYPEDVVIHLVSDNEKITV
ncbi:type VI secretion system tip protein TssI/VgrG [Orbus sturtevantii]|uniref:type VI secretion system Vgr family protein n=1 Tax=Orbus sturtevantii TaxID=3074109 RepID=UPI00370D8685